MKFNLDNIEKQTRSILANLDEIDRRLGTSIEVSAEEERFIHYKGYDCILGNRGGKVTWHPDGVPGYVQTSGYIAKLSSVWPSEEKRFAKKLRAAGIELP